jgi:AcrR family transcriptional regulator
MLNMHSAQAASTGEADRTARSRIRDAAIARFAADGVAATSLRAIAEDAGVSTPLVVHHFGSKDKLRVACDEHVAALIRERKQAAMAQGPQLDPLAAMRQVQHGPPILRYLARTLGDGAPQVAALVDELVDDAEVYMEEGVRNGLLKPGDDPRGRAVILTIWSLGALTLHEHMHRLLGVDLIGGAGDMTPYMVPAAEILARGVIDDDFYARLRQALDDPTEQDS